jgi:hypothetical protein
MRLLVLIAMAKAIAYLKTCPQKHESPPVSRRAFSLYV